MDFLRKTMSLHKARKSQWLEFSRLDSPDREALLNFRPDWKLERGVRITTIAWKWFVDMTHSNLEENENVEKQIIHSMRANDSIGRRLCLLQKVLGEDILYLITSKHLTK